MDKDLNDYEEFEGANKELVNIFACSACSADLRYQPGTKQLICEHCGTTNEIPEIGTPVNENDFLEFIEKASEQSQKIELVVVNCNQCGANTTLDPNIKSHFCPYCNSPLVKKSEHCDTVISPTGILPFKIQKRDAEDQVKQWVKKLWFAPNILKKHSLDKDRFKGVYIPYWTFDSNTSSTYLGQKGTYYYETVRYTTKENGKMVSKTRQERRVHWTTVSGNVNHFFDDELVIASKSLPIKRMVDLEPWDLKNIQAFDYAFLGGFITEKYQRGLKESFEIAKNKMAKKIQTFIKRDIGGDEQRILNVNTEHNNITFKHILLPVYVSAFRFKGKTYRILVNGRTGEVQGERPYSIGKIVGLVIILILLFVLVFALSAELGQ